MRSNVHGIFKLALVERLHLANGVHDGVGVGGGAGVKLDEKGSHPEQLRNRKIDCLLT